MKQEKAYCETVTYRQALKSLSHPPKKARQGATQALRPPPKKTYDLVLQAVGRTPNGKKISAEKAGVAVTDRGFIKVDIQMCTNVPHIFAIGDIIG